MGEKTSGTKYIESIIAGEENPFSTLEALGEVIGAAWGALAKQGIDVWVDDEGKPTRSSLGHRPKGEVGSIVYYLEAIDDKSKRIFQAFAVLCHDLYLADEGNLDAEGLERLNAELQKLADKYQAYWDDVRNPYNIARSR